MVAEQRKAIKETVEPPAGGFAEVKTRHAGTRSTPTPGVESAPPLSHDQVGEEAVERGLEHGLQAAEDEVSS